MPDVRSLLSINEAHKFPVFVMPSRHDSGLSEGADHVGSGCGFLKTAKHFDKLRPLIIQIQMRVNTVCLHFMNGDSPQV
jgi:hypothetical protein